MIILCILFILPVACAHIYMQHDMQEQQFTQFENPIDDIIAQYYPAHYVVHQLSPDEKITIDGDLNEPVWQNVPWLDQFTDLAGPRYIKNETKQISWQDAAKAYQNWLTSTDNPTRVKARWDDNYLYIAAELKSNHPHATVTGHCDKLKSNVWDGLTPVIPYLDDDFEVFLNPSQSNYYYVEYEMNLNNATYDVLWSLPQAGLGSVAPECGGGNLNKDKARGICCNTTWNGGKALCEKGDVEKEAGIWTMEMYDKEKRPGSGMLTAAKNNSNSWTVEIRFPIFSNSEHGGVVNLNQGGFYPGTDPTLLHPRSGQRFWGATFANALHAPWWADLTNVTVKEQMALIQKKCHDVVNKDFEKQGFSQFLLDGNNLLMTCYYEASSQNLGGHRYMHNPDQYGYFQFAPAKTKENPCRNVQWLARFVLAMIYQAEVKYLQTEGKGTYTADLTKLLDDKICTIDNACNSTILHIVTHGIVEIHLIADERATTGHCAQYPIESIGQKANWTGGPCFDASVTYNLQSKTNPQKVRHVSGQINEARWIHFVKDVGQRWNDDDADWLCIDDVHILHP